MLSGGPAMLKAIRSVRDAAGFTISAGIGWAGDDAIECASSSQRRLEPAKDLRRIQHAHLVA